MRFICTSIVATLMLAGATFAETINVPSDHDTIQGAINASSDGDVIAIAAGTYYENELNPSGKAITIGSASGNQDVTIDAQQGGSVFVIDSGEDDDTVIKDLVITGGSDNYGGGIHCYGSDPTITNCTIEGNISTNHGGGGIYCYGSDPTITGCTISDNTANYDPGGGIYCTGSSNPTITGCTITGNAAQYGGGGIYCYNSSDPTLIDCTISGNTSSSSGGGGIKCLNSSPTLSGCEISNNTVSGNYNGGGIYCDASNPTITNCTISGNTSTSSGGGIYCANDSGLTLTDTIVCGNGDINDQIYGTWINGGGVCIAFACDDWDGDGVPDKCGSIGDGIHEVPSEYATIQSAIEAAGYGDTVLVGPGTYTSTVDWVISPGGKTITIQSTDGPEVTILDGEGARRVVQCGAGETAATIIEGFTITGGYKSGDGGGICFTNSSAPTLTNCTISNNTANGLGGGIYCYNDSNPTLIDCTISGNTATSSGGGIFCNGTLFTITGCTFLGNASTDYGGAIGVSGNESHTITGCTFTSNTSKLGGGIGVVGGSTNPGSMTLSGCEFDSNYAHYFLDLDSGRGGAAYFENCQIELIQCDFQNNFAEFFGGAICNQDASNAEIENCTIAENSAPFGGGIYSAACVSWIASTEFCGNTTEDIYGAWVDEGGNGFNIDCDRSCRSDINSDHEVDHDDLMSLLNAWGATSGPADINDNGLVEIVDLITLLKRWGSCR